MYPPRLVEMYIVHSLFLNHDHLFFHHTIYASFFQNIRVRYYVFPTMRDIVWRVANAIWEVISTIFKHTGLDEVKKEYGGLIRHEKSIIFRLVDDIGLPGPRITC